MTVHGGFLNENWPWWASRFLLYKPWGRSRKLQTTNSFLVVVVRFSDCHRLRLTITYSHVAQLCSTSTSFFFFIHSLPSFLLFVQPQLRLQRPHQRDSWQWHTAVSLLLWWSSKRANIVFLPFTFSYFIFRSTTSPLCPFLSSLSLSLSTTVSTVVFLLCSPLFEKLCCRFLPSGVLCWRFE